MNVKTFLITILIFTAILCSTTKGENLPYSDSQSHYIFTTLMEHSLNRKKCEILDQMKWLRRMIAICEAEKQVEKKQQIEKKLYELAASLERTEQFLQCLKEEHKQLPKTKQAEDKVHEYNSPDTQAEPADTLEYGVTDSSDDLIERIRERDAERRRYEEERRARWRERERKATEDYKRTQRKIWDDRIRGMAPDFN